MPKRTSATAKSKTEGLKQRQEADFACVIAGWLREQGYEIFCEVPYGRSGRRIDIVVKNGDEYWAVEVKTSDGLEVLEQAYYWKKDFHYVYIAVPEGCRKGKAGSKNRFFQEVAKKLGIGVIRAKMGVFDSRSTDPCHGAQTKRPLCRSRCDSSIPDVNDRPCFPVVSVRKIFRPEF